MLPYEEALQRVLEAAQKTETETVPLEDCRGRVLAEDLLAREDNPLFDNSAMDGYAVRSEDLGGAGPESPVSLKVAGETPAGGSSLELASGQAIRIFTGAPLPRGADTVVMQEDVDRKDGEVLFTAPARRGKHVRARGEDVRAGTPLLRAGTRLAPLRLAILASQGWTDVMVSRRPKTSIVCTGDELMPLGAALTPGKVRNASGVCLSAAVRDAGGEPSDHGAVPDDPKDIARTLKSASESADILLVGGGVSVGDYDHTGTVLKDLGMETVFWKVAIKPGKPLLFGRLGTTLVFGLPGNPVSSWASFELFVRPAIARMLGLPARAPFPERGRVLNAFPACEKRRQLLFCRAREEDGEAVLEIIRPQSSGTLALAAGANAAAFPPGEGREVKEGDVVPFRRVSG